MEPQKLWTVFQCKWQQKFKHLRERTQHDFFKNVKKDEGQVFDNKASWTMGISKIQQMSPQRDQNVQNICTNFNKENIKPYY